jgi:peptidyl-prolyl cis-trans isomerase D
VAIGLVAYLGAYFSCDTGAQRASAYAALVNGEEISVRTFQVHARRIDQNYRRLFGENYEQLKAQMRIGTQAIQSLVEERLILQDAERLGLTVTEAERDKAVREILTDPSTGEYVGQQLGEQLVRQNYGSVADFMSLVDSDLVMQKWSDLVTATANVSEDELIEAFRQRNEKTAVDFVVVPSTDQEIDEPSLSEDAVARWYEEHLDDYFREEGRRIRYVVIERQAQLEQVEISEEEVRASYEANQASYAHPEQRRAMHILFRVAPDTTDEERTRLRGVAESVRERVLAGEEFSELAAAYSQDPGSAERGGDLGFFSRGDMVGPFDAAAFETPVGEVAPVVETDFGFHVIQVTDERLEGVTPLEDVAEEIRRNLQLRGAQDRVLDPRRATCRPGCRARVHGNCIRPGARDEQPSAACCAGHGFGRGGRDDRRVGGAVGRSRGEGAQRPAQRAVTASRANCGAASSRSGRRVHGCGPETG